MKKHSKTFGLVGNHSKPINKPAKRRFIFFSVVAFLLAFVAILGRLLRFYR
jgi:hypothetical protein